MKAKCPCYAMQGLQQCVNHETAAADMDVDVDVDVGSSPLNLMFIVYL